MLFDGLFWCAEIVSLAHAGRDSWKQRVEPDSRAVCLRFGPDQPQRVLLYSKPGRGGVEMIVLVMSAECVLMGTSPVTLKGISNFFVFSYRPVKGGVLKFAVDFGMT